MKVILVGKSAYSTEFEGEQIPIILAGHTVQLIRPLAEMLLSTGARVAHVFPAHQAPGESAITDPGDELPPGLLLHPYRSPRPGKSVHDLGALALQEALFAADHGIGGADWVIFVNAFPQLLVAQPALASMNQPRHRMRTGVLLRGGDAYKWPDAIYAGRALGDPRFGAVVAGRYREALDRADLKLVASEWLGETLAQHGLRADGVLPSPPVAASPNDQVSSKLQVSNFSAPGELPPVDRHWLLVAGRIHPDKAPDLALAAFARANLPEWHLILAGSGEPGYLRSLLGNLPKDLRSRVTTLAVPPRLLPALYCASDAVLHTSVPTPDFIDARPSTVTSAASHGKPVVAVRAGGIEESLSPFNLDALCMPFDPSQDEESLARRLAGRLGALRDPVLRLQAGEANAAHLQASRNDLGLHDLLVLLDERATPYERGQA